jgi:uncharacterized membrane protein YfcA
LSRASQALPGRNPLFVPGGGNVIVPVLYHLFTLPGMVLIVLATMATTAWGARLAHAIDARRRRQVFALFLALTSLRMFYGLLA